MTTDSTPTSSGISSLALAAKRVIDAAWVNGPAYDLASVAAFALESAQLLQSPDTAAEFEKLLRWHDEDAKAIEAATRLRGDLRSRIATLEADREANDREYERVTARVAELEKLVEQATEFRVWESGYGLYVRRAPGTTGFAVMEARRTDKGRRVWTTSGWQYATILSDSEMFCWPDAQTAVIEARRIMPGGAL